MNQELIEAAARLIRGGKVVAFPTETVYGLGANALDAAAVEQIYGIKGRPASSPLIVHVSSEEMARELAREWPRRATALAERFWPGPLTMVVAKSEIVSDRITAGLPTVGIRVPRHPVALALIQAAGVPIAAPSANRFSKLSPTTAEHVRRSLGEQVAMVLDGGPTEVGIESTVVSLAGPEAVLLRPGMISQAQLEEVIGTVRRGAAPQGEAHPAPGMHVKHYSPSTPLYVVEPGVLPPSGRGAYLWIRMPAPSERSIRMPDDPHEYARRLYETLHDLDGLGLSWIAVEKLPGTVAWAGIADRIERASMAASRPE